ncbi:sodium-dependent transporter [Anaerofustis stercorihominis]|uniref:sodium-dependent transporter n=1 Tax=Anaerofustis stercorihominis TaxID=214853 RepID=UPI0026721A5B|nr:sodium-dependent transporter [Anaerofustis stercorihominis]
MKNNNNQWASKIGFLLATAGAAIGLGNLWKFPYLMGKNGGFPFLLAYLFFILILGIPVMITEMSIGRMSRHNPVKAYEIISPRAKIVGILGVLSAFLILSYYSVIGGWMLKYFFSYLTTFDAPESFEAFISSPVEPIVWHFIFMLLTGVICFFGVSGIEKASKIMMPTLFVLIIIIIIRGLTLPEAGEGLKFIFKPNFGNFTFDSINTALSQVFYSLSLCMGITITYGSYLSKKENIEKSCLNVALLDTCMAILAGIAIFPAVFSFGLEPGQGPSLIFGTLPKVFASMSGGSIFALLFFLIMFFAALTSAIALLEVSTSFTIDSLKWDRKKSIGILTIVIFFLGIFSSLSFGPLADVSILGYTFFDFIGMITDNILLPLGGIFMCYYVGWKWDTTKLIDEMESSGHPFRLKKIWLFCIKYITPVLVLIVTVTGFINIYTKIIG